MSSSADTNGLQAPSEGLRDPVLVIVPREPTEAMTTCFKKAWHGDDQLGGSYVEPSAARAIWLAMIHAAPDTVLGFRVVPDPAVPRDQMRLENEHGAVIVVNVGQIDAAEAISPYLRQPTRSATEAALAIAVKGLTIIAKPVTGESHLERTMRMAAQTALDRVRALVPDVGA